MGSYNMGSYNYRVSIARIIELYGLRYKSPFLDIQARTLFSQNIAFVILLLSSRTAPLLPLFLLLCFGFAYLLER